MFTGRSRRAEAELMHDKETRVLEEFLEAYGE